MFLKEVRKIKLLTNYFIDKIVFIRLYNRNNMGKEFATRNLIHEKIPEFPGGSDADVFLTKSEIIQQTFLVNVIDSRDNEIPIMDNVVESSITFTADLMNVRLPQDTSGILIAIVSQINGQYADWSVESVSDYFNAYKRDNNNLVISAKENQTTENEKRGSVVIVQSASGQKLELSVTQAAGEVTYEYVFSIDPTSGTISANGGGIQVNIQSYKKKYINGVYEGFNYPVGLSVGYLSGDDFNSINRDGLPNYVTISSGENQNERVLSEIDRFTQDESGKTIDFTYNQEAAVITYKYTFFVNPASFIWANSEYTTKKSYVDSIKVKYRNGNYVSQESVGYSFNTFGLQAFTANLANDTITISRVGGSTGAIENIFLQQSESKTQRSISLEIERE